MEKIDYSLAPSGSTHEYHGMWRKVENGLWRHWNGSIWDICAPARVSDYEPIPEREQVINRLADNSTEWLASDDFLKYEIKISEIEERCKKRIEAGLIKESNDLDHVSDTDVVEIEEKGTNRYGLDMGYFSNLMNREFASLSNYKPDEFARACARMAKAADESVLTEKEFAPEPSKEWINGFPPAGVECEVREIKSISECFSNWSTCIFIAKNIGSAGENQYIIKDNNGDAAILYESGGVEFRPLKTDEQIAAEKRLTWVDDVCMRVAVKSKSLMPSQVLMYVYDALLDVSLEAPKGDDV